MLYHSVLEMSRIIGENEEILWGYIAQKQHTVLFLSCFESLLYFSIKWKRTPLASFHLAKEGEILLEIFKAFRIWSNVMLWKFLRSPLKNAPPEPFFAASNLYCILRQMKKDAFGVLSFGGEGEIRTLEPFVAVTRFPIVRARPTTRLLRVDLM